MHSVQDEAVLDDVIDRLLEVRAGRPRASGTADWAGGEAIVCHCQGDFYVPAQSPGIRGANQDLW